MINIYQFERNKLYSYLGEDLVETLKAYKCVVAGGTITSLFCNREINDIDVYFKSEEDAIDFISEIWDSQTWIYSHTKKATLMKINDIDVQMIHFDYFETVDDIFNTFDFTVCMGAYDFSKEEFVLHNDFLKHNSQRLIKFNSKTAYPIVSLLRVQKYQDKGYLISKPEFLRVVMTCMNLDINTYEELKEQLGGMYGINYDKLFEEMKDEEFDLQTAIDKIADLSLNDDYFVKPIEVTFDNLDELLSDISSKPIKWFAHKGKKYKVNYRGILDAMNKPIENSVEITPEEYFTTNRFYKFVKKVDGKYFSYHDEDFEYKIGNIVEAKGLESTWGNEGKLHFVELKDLRNATHSDKKGAVVIEAIINEQDFRGLSGHIMARKCIVLREVPKEEYGKYLGIDVEENDEDYQEIPWN